MFREPTPLPIGPGSHSIEFEGGNDVVQRLALLTLASLGYNHEQWRVQITNGERQPCLVELHNSCVLPDDLGEAAHIATVVSSNLEAILQARPHTSVVFHR
jgi:hypothetical protein